MRHLQPRGALGAALALALASSATADSAAAASSTTADAPAGTSVPRHAGSTAPRALLDEPAPWWWRAPLASDAGEGVPATPAGFRFQGTTMSLWQRTAAERIERDVRSTIPYQLPPADLFEPWSGPLGPDGFKRRF